ncbi:MAG TPA: PHB depolymerase family esterase [Labilithrix sp.]|nr:PHB depolymerase family esterase [Labilithrix sp.]
MERAATFLFFTLALAAGGCDADASSSSGGDGAPAPSADVETTTKTFSFSGATRKYVVSVPFDLDTTRKYPLVMVLHGSPGTAEGMIATFPFESVSKRKAIVVYPNALGSDWDLYGANPNADMDFLRELVSEVGKSLPVDAARVFGTGWSGGGFFVSQTACRFGGLFRAIAIHAGGAPDESSDPSAQKDSDGFFVCPGGALPVIVVHGRADTTVEPGSGEFAAQHWAHVAGCGDTQTAATPSPCQDYAGCPSATPVRVCMIPGLGHPMWDQGHAASWAFFESLP